jgi:hypothetical protein
MRLINVNNYSLSKFIGRNIPPYAILSHTWGDDEVSLKDIQDVNAASRKEGFKKIDFCCKQAKEENFEWVWVDTCCIDKTSSAELSEAINSMFQWYSRAMVCYAYLSDVSISYDDRLENFCLTSFRQSRWFTRGWTLQELLAPLTVQFFSSNWSYIGSKKQLAPLIGEITGIPENILDDYRSPLEQTVYARMHWASRRETTREEDMAYCLLGLFDVNIPLLYGEGTKAFHRLQGEIIKNFDDHTIFLWDFYPVKIVPDEGRILVYRTGFYAGLLADSPHQFDSKCIVGKLYIPGTREPIQISQKGSHMKLYLKKIPRIASARSYIFPQRVGYNSERLYLAALNCIVRDAEYIAEPSFDRVHDDGERRGECMAMLLMRYDEGFYQRVLSYYELVSVQEVREHWECSTCYITKPYFPIVESPYDSEGLVVKYHELSLRWSGPAFGYKVIEEFSNQDLSVFLLAQNSTSPYGMFITVLCSTHLQSALHVMWQEDQPDVPKPDLEGVATNYSKDASWPVQKAGTGPVLEKSFSINDKELVLTLSIEEAIYSPMAPYSGHTWTLWLSFRQPMNRSINKVILKAISEQ